MIKKKKEKKKEFLPWSHLKTSWPKQRSSTFESGIQYKDRDHIFSSHPNSHHLFLFFFLLRLTILPISLYFFDWSLRLFLIFRSKFLYRCMCTKFSGIFKFSFGEDLFWIQNFLFVLLEKLCSGLDFLIMGYTHGYLLGPSIRPDSKNDLLLYFLFHYLFWISWIHCEKLGEHDFIHFS